MFDILSWACLIPILWNAVSKEVNNFILLVEILVVILIISLMAIVLIVLTRFILHVWFTFKLR